ncbi:MAG: 2'-5' RNA ligase family protein [Microbacterium sp.]|uniref:2'-5' RNA ligase family protein n=1 Tax=Microbacterium sp. TaxID=51671 RepID=UPI003F96CE0C
MSRTALIVEAPASATLAALREKFAADARFDVPPHLTVLFPFVPAELIDNVVTERLARTFRGMREFDFSLTRTGWFGEEVLWLAPESPAPFIELTAAVTRAFPAYPPYGGVHDGSVPHATVGDSAGYEALQQAERTIREELPLRGTASAVALLIEDSRGHWRRERLFAFSLGDDK